MSSSYEEIANRLFGTPEQNPPQPAMPDLDGAVDTSGGIAAALSISPSEFQHAVHFQTFCVWNDLARNGKNVCDVEGGSGAYGRSFQFYC